MYQFVEKHWMCILLTSCLLVYGMVHLERALPEPIRSDGVGYYAYLPALFIHGDPSFHTLAALRFDGEIPSWTGMVRYPATGRYANIYGVGVAILLAPFFVVAHLLTLVFQSPASWHKFNHVPDGFSFFYQHAAGLAGMCYGLAGLVFLRKSIEKYFSPSVCLVTVFVLFMGTNLFNYLSAETVLSHPYTFFLFGVLLSRLPLLYRSERVQVKTAFQTGALLGLATCVRPTNGLFLLPIMLWGVRTWDEMRERALLWVRHWSRLLALVCGLIVAFLPQLVMWRYSSGHWWFNAYKELFGARIYWMKPQFFGVLLSLRGGVLFWSPVLFLALIGFIWFRRYSPDMFWPSVVFLVPFTYLIASWHDWAFGGGFGHRGFVEAYVFLAFPMAAFFQRVGEAQHRWIRWGLTLITVGMVAYSLFFQMLYYTRELSFYGLDRQALFDIFWWRKQRLEAWWHMLMN